MLGKWDFASEDAAALVAEFGASGVARALDAARRLQAKGTLGSPKGFIQWQLREHATPPQPTPGAIAPPPPPPPQSSPETVDVTAELSDAVLSNLAATVLEANAARPAMVRLLSSKPPRESPLMMAEIRALLGVAGGTETPADASG